MGIRRGGSGDAFIRGAEVWRHKMAMGVEALAVNLSVAGLAACLVSWALLFSLATSTEWRVFWFHQVATVASFFGLGQSRLLERDVVFPGLVQLRNLTPSEVLELTRAGYQSMRWKSWVAGAAGSAMFVWSFIVFGRFQHRFGLRAGQNQFLRGATLEPKAVVSEQVNKCPRGAGQFSVAGVPIPKGMEMRNFLFTGAMGAGKTVAIESLMDQVFSSGRKAIVYDKKAEFVERHFRPDRDFILNPFDQRFPGWSFFAEIENVYQFEQYAHSLIPDSEGSKGAEKYFSQAARSVFANVAERMWRAGMKSTRELYDQCARVTPKELAEYLKGTEAAIHINPDAGEQAAGVLSTLLNALSSFRFVKDGNFSIVEWIRRDDDSRLFIPSHPSVHDVLLPVLSMYVDVAIRATMTLPQIGHDRLWIFLDELASLKTLPVLKMSLTEARSFGVVHVVGVQNVAQLKVNFGDDISKVLRSNLQHKLILRVEDEETQEAYSKILGAQELDEQSENLSFGAEPERDSSGMQVARKEKRLVMPSEIKMLDDCEGYLQLAGPFPICKVSYTPKPRPAVAQGFMPREDLRLSRSDETANAIEEGDFF